MEQVYSVARTVIEDRGWTITHEEPPPALATRAAQPSAQEQPTEPPGGKKTVLTQSRLEVTGAAAEEATPAAPAETPGTYVVEAVATTPLFGFADLVALRLSATPEGTQLDMRSASQIGRHDLGQNARRIRAFMAALDTALQAAPEAPPVPPPAGPTEEESEPAADEPESESPAAEEPPTQ